MGEDWECAVRFGEGVIKEKSDDYTNIQTEHDSITGQTIYFRVNESTFSAATSKNGPWYNLNLIGGRHHASHHHAARRSPQL